MNVEAMIKRLKGKKYSVTRASGAGYYGANGVYVQGSTTALQILGSVQPLDYETLISIPEGDRTTERFRFYSFYPLLNNQAELLAHGDVVSVSGVDYRVESVAHWPGYSKSVIVRVNNASN